MELKENEIVIFRNEKKEDGSKQPDYRGEMQIGGELKSVALWVRESKGGKKFFSGLISDPYRKEGAAPNISDDLPF